MRRVFVTGPAKARIAVLADRYRIERELGQGGNQLVITLNWFEELKARVPR